MMSWKVWTMPALTMAFGLTISACASRPAPTVQPEPVEIIETYQIPEDTSRRPTREIWASTDEGIRHLPSGAICPTKIETYFLVKQSAIPGLARGFDVACQFDATDGGKLTLHLTNFGREVSPSAHLKGVERAIRESHTITRITEPPTGSGGTDITRQQMAFLLAPSPDGQSKPKMTAVWIEPVGHWHVKVRATTALSEANTLGRAVDRIYSKARSDIRKDTT